MERWWLDKLVNMLVILSCKYYWSTCMSCFWSLVKWIRFVIVIVWKVWSERVLLATSKIRQIILISACRLSLLSTIAQSSSKQFLFHLINRIDDLEWSWNALLWIWRQRTQERIIFWFLLFLWYSRKCMFNWFLLFFYGWINRLKWFFFLRLSHLETLTRLLLFFFTLIWHLNFFTVWWNWTTF